MRNIKEVILAEVKKQGRVNSENIANICNVTRQAAHLHLCELVKLKKILKIGKTRGSYYILYSKEKEEELGKTEKRYRVKLKNKTLEEDKIYDKIIYHIPSIKKLPQNIQDITYYSFSEMLNNAIEYSNSAFIDVFFIISGKDIKFEVVDNGIGIFNHIQNKFKLNDKYEAITELLKGKKTTIPSRHTGEGIFFTSKIADVYNIESSKIKLIINNKEKDIYIEEISSRNGTKIYFQINKRTRKELKALFEQYTDNEYKFSKTKIVIKLYQKDVKYMSRSQARRVTLGLEKFKIVVLDFNKVKIIGQGFVDEIFRVFQTRHPNIKIEAINCCKAVRFMINRAKSDSSDTLRTSRTASIFI